jgi:uncharacterized membrane protein
MRQDRYTTLTGIAFLAGIIATVYGYITISGEMATHFTATGQPDGTMAKIPGLLFAPGMMAVVYGFFRVLPRIDPLEENYERFREAYRGMIVAVLGFLAYLQVVLVGWNVGLAFNMTQAITPAVAALLFIAGGHPGSDRVRRGRGRRPQTVDPQSLRTASVSFRQFE